MELPGAANPFAFTTGFVMEIGRLHLIGIGFGTLVRWPAGTYAVRARGGAIALAGSPSSSALPKRPAFGALVFVRPRSPLPMVVLSPDSKAYIWGWCTLYLGMVHPLSTPPQLLALLALGLLLGQ